MYSIITIFLYIKGEFIRPKFFNQLSEKNNKMYGIILESLINVLA